MKIYTAMLVISGLFPLVGCIQKPESQMNGLLIIKEQDSFTVGETVMEQPGINDRTKFDNFTSYPEGQTYHGDHAYVFYQMPDNGCAIGLCTTGSKKRRENKTRTYQSVKTEMAMDGRQKCGIIGRPIS